MIANGKNATETITERIKIKLRLEKFCRSDVSRIGYIMKVKKKENLNAYYGVSTCIFCSAIQKN